MVHTEIGYQNYRRQKQFYRKYPAFFSDRLQGNLQHEYRLQEGTKAGLTADYASDNFDNTIGRTGAFAEWGNRQKYIHRIVTEGVFVGSRIDQNSLSGRLVNVDYSYQRLWPEKGFQFTAGAGFFYDDHLRPDAKLKGGYARDSTFTSAELTFKPVLTNTALRRNINELRLSMYREDYFTKGILQTTGSVVGKRYSNDVYSVEAQARLYVKLPFSTAHNRIRGIAELSFADATEPFTSGVPFYTADQLLIQGIGAEFRYRNLLKNPNLSIELELTGKNDTRDGLFLTSSARLQKYWKISLNAALSSSFVYRYSQVGITVSYIFPKYLYPAK